MKIISKTILAMYLCVAINGMAYAAGSVSTGIGALNINPSAAVLYKQIAQPAVNLSAKNALTDFVQDIPRMGCYEWFRVREENKKFLALLSKI